MLGVEEVSCCVMAGIGRTPKRCVSSLGVFGLCVFFIDRPSSAYPGTGGAVLALGHCIVITVMGSCGRNISSGHRESNGSGLRASSKVGLRGFTRLMTSERWRKEEGRFSDVRLVLGELESVLVRLVLILEILERMERMEVRESRQEGEGESGEPQWEGEGDSGKEAYMKNTNEQIFIVDTPGQ